MHRAVFSNLTVRGDGSSTVVVELKGPLGGGQGLESQTERCVLSLLLPVRRRLLEPALQRAVGIHVPSQLRAQSLDLCQEAVQVTDSVLPRPAFSRHLCSGLCKHGRREALTSSTTKGSAMQGDRRGFKPTTPTTLPYLRIRYNLK